MLAAWTPTTMPRRWFRARRLPRASMAAAVAYWEMALARRRRGWARKAGRGFGVGTLRTLKFLAGPATVWMGRSGLFSRASRSGFTPQPAGETAPQPRM